MASTLSTRLDRADAGLVAPAAAGTLEARDGGDSSRGASGQPSRARS